MINIGAMDRTIQLQRRTLSQDSTGEMVESWTNDHLCFARRIIKQGKTTLQDKQEVAWKDVTYQTYYVPGITEANHRLVDGSEIYSIISVMEMGRQDGLEILCKAKDNQP
jgi:head-tail adaptor